MIIQFDLIYRIIEDMFSIISIDQYWFANRLMIKSIFVILSEFKERKEWRSRSRNKIQRFQNDLISPAIVLLICCYFFHCASCTIDFDSVMTYKSFHQENQSSVIWIRFTVGRDTFSAFLSKILNTTCIDSEIEFLEDWEKMNINNLWNSSKTDVNSIIIVLSIGKHH